MYYVGMIETNSLKMLPNSLHAIYSDLFEEITRHGKTITSLQDDHVLVCISMVKWAEYNRISKREKQKFKTNGKAWDIFC